MVGSAHPTKLYPISDSPSNGCCSPCWHCAPINRMRDEQTYPWDNRPKLDPKDFMFMKLTSGVHIKAPGSVNGQQFIIDSCENCDLYVLDHTAQVTIDDCKNCRIFIGPTEASIFIRDCEDCKCVFICRQFRTRDIQNVDISLHCATRPVIETSKGLRFGCYGAHYIDKKIPTNAFDCPSSTRPDRTCV